MTDTKRVTVADLPAYPQFGRCGPLDPGEARRQFMLAQTKVLAGMSVARGAWPASEVRRLILTSWSGPEVFDVLESLVREGRLVRRTRPTERLSQGKHWRGYEFTYELAPRLVAPKGGGR